MTLVMMRGTELATQLPRTGLVLDNILKSLSSLHLCSSLKTKKAFHTSVSKQGGNSKILKYDYDIREPRNREEWQFRYQRYSKLQKLWIKKIPMGIPQLQHIPEGHVDRNGNPYTTECLPWEKTNGRDQAPDRETKYIQNYKIRGGVDRRYRMVDLTRLVPVGETSPFAERVLEIVDDETSSPFIALVANGNFKRWILASENMKVGDLVKTYNEIPRNPVQAFEGDAYPLGALPVGTMVHNIEVQPGQGGRWCVNAGTYGTITKRVEDRVLVLMYKTKKTRHGQEISVDERCMATVGRVSNVNHHLIPIKSTTMPNYGLLFKLGYRPRSGLWQKKTSRFGRAIKPPPRLLVYQDPPKPFTPIYKN